MMTRDYIRIARVDGNQISIETVWGSGSYTLTFHTFWNARVGYQIEPVSLDFDWGGYGVMSFEGWPQADSQALAMGSMRITTPQGLVELDYGPDFVLKRVIRHDPRYDYMSSSSYILGQRIGVREGNMVRETTYSRNIPVDSCMYTLPEYLNKCPSQVRTAVQGWM